MFSVEDPDVVTARGPGRAVSPLQVLAWGGAPVGGGSGRVNDTLHFPGVFDPSRALPLLWMITEPSRQGSLHLKARTPDFPVPGPLHPRSEEELMGN